MPPDDATQFDPPAPTVEVALRHPGTGETVTGVTLLLDTGADITLLPRAAAVGIGIDAIGQQYELVGFDGTKSLAAAVVADLLLLKRAFRGQYLLIEEDRGILGRDILNHLSLLLDGPHQQWSEHAP